MLNLFLILIIISSFICAMSVIIGCRSKRRVFPAVSAVCSVFIIAFAFCCMIETELSDENISASRTYVAVTEAQKSVSESEKTSAEKSESPKTQKHENSGNNLDRIVYITKTGEKYHFSYSCSDTDFYECTLRQALERGLEPCSRCAE